jgi:hypothetical protein
MSVERSSAEMPVRSCTQALWSGATARPSLPSMALKRGTQRLQTPQAPSYKIHPLGGASACRPAHIL